MPSLKNSVYWKNEISVTQDQLAELLKSETFEVQTAKSDEDSITYQSIKERVRILREYLMYCEKEYEDALQEENNIPVNKSILYFEREYGY